MKLNMGMVIHPLRYLLGELRKPLPLKGIPDPYGEHRNWEIQQAEAEAWKERYNLSFKYRALHKQYGDGELSKESLITEIEKDKKILEDQMASPKYDLWITRETYGITIALLNNVQEMGTTEDMIKRFNELISNDQMDKIEEFLQKYDIYLDDKWFLDEGGKDAVEKWRRYPVDDDIEKANWPMAYKLKKECVFNLRRWETQQSMQDGQPCSQGIQPSPRKEDMIEKLLEQIVNSLSLEQINSKTTGNANERQQGTTLPEYEKNYLMIRLKEETATGYQMMKKLMEEEAINYDEGHFDFMWKTRGSIGSFFNHIGFKDYKLFSDYVTHRGEAVDTITFSNGRKNTPTKEWIEIEKIK